MCDRLKRHKQNIGSLGATRQFKHCKRTLPFFFFIKTKILLVMIDIPNTAARMCVEEQQG